MLARTFERIAAHDIVWRAVDPALGVTGFRCRSGNRYVYWRSIGEAIVIMAILHGRMDQVMHLGEIDVS